MWLSQEMSELEANSSEASAFQVQLKKSEEYSICAGQSLVFLTFSAACIQVMTRIGSRAPGGNRMQRHKAVRTQGSHALTAEPSRLPIILVLSKVSRAHLIGDKCHNT